MGLTLDQAIPLHPRHGASAAKDETGECQGIARILVHFRETGAAAQIAPHLDVGADRAAGLIDIAQGEANFVPGHPALARYAAITFSGMEMPQQRASRADGLAKAVFLDIHVKRIQHDFHVVLADILDESDAFGSRIEHVVFKAVEDFDAKVDAEFIGEIGNAVNTFHAARIIACLVDRLRVVDRPVGVQRAANRMDVELGDIGKGAFKERLASCANRGILLRQVFRFRRADTGSEYDAVIFLPHSHEEAARAVPKIKTCVDRP